MITNKDNIPTILVILGATGDLIKKKIAPSLFHLFKKGNLPERFKVVGFSLKELSDKDFSNFIFDILTKHKGINVEECADFCRLFSYQRGNFQNKNDYTKLSKSLSAIDKKWGICTNKIFYLAVPPQFYEIIFKNLASSGLTKPCSPDEGWSRILVEKPFGKDLKTAESLEKLLGNLFKEIQIYRIDHYLAKEMLQNILAFRFSNNLFEQSWNKDFIEKIEIRLWEKIGVEHRGSFYDGLGALRDVGQNHLLQMLALVTMNHPVNFSASAIRKQREEILQSLIMPGDDEIKNFSFRAQYSGYQAISGVAKKSKTETYFKIRASLSSPRWAGVPIILESGKRLVEQKKEIEITFKHPTPCLCPPKDNKHYANKVIISLEPSEAITFQFWSKKPGFKFEMEKRKFNFLFRRSRGGTQYIEEYEKLLLDAIIGDQTLFVSTNEVVAMWRFIDPVINAWQKNKVQLVYYKPNTAQPIAESAFINESALGPEKKLKMEIGVIGLGKMGANIGRRLMEKGWKVVGYDNTAQITKSLEKEGLEGACSLVELVSKLPKPRLIWLMVPASAMNEVIKELLKHLSVGDVVIDGGNSFYKDSLARFKKLKSKGINFIDVGVSGGPQGARYGASLMIGGERRLLKKLESLFYDLSQKNGYQFFEGPGAGHFVKMIHNGIEYGMMQAIAEGFTILKKSKYKLNLNKVADVYNNGSVIESRLVGWLKKAFEIRGQELQKVSSKVEHTGEGKWTVNTAKELKIKARVIEEALRFRVESAKNPNYTGKILSALREQFGGHKVTKMP